VNRNRRILIMASVAMPLVPTAFAAQAQPFVEVWKSPTCGCCKDWIKHLEANGFKVRTIEVQSTAPMRAKLGMPELYGSCHTALVNGYVLEGHVPASDIRRLLAEKPRALGLAVPGMPVGSPGMDGPEYGGRKDAFDVLLIGRDGSATGYRSYN
jgi:hypothetical protein